LVAQFLKLYESGNLQVENQPLIVETFRLPKTGGENLARIISLRLFNDSEFKSTFKDDEPYIIFDEKTNILILRHTPEKLELIKRLMRDSKFVQQVTDRTLKARKFTVVPAEDLRSETPDAQLRRRKQVQFTKQVFQSLLYGSQSIEEAAAEGRVMYPDQDEGTIDVVDTPDNLRKIDEYLQGITETTQLTRTIIIQRRDVAELGYALQGLVLTVYINETSGGQIGEGGQQEGNQQDRQQNQSGQGSQGGQFGFFGVIPVVVTADIQTKQMVISGFRLSDLDKAEDLIRQLDVPVEQVEIEVRLVELTYDSSDEFGVTMAISNILEIDDDDEPGPGMTLADAAMDFVSQPNNPAGSSVTLATLGRTTIDATLNFLAQFTDIRILTAPKVTVVSGRQGHVFLGETIPYIASQTLTVPAGSDTPVLQSTPARSDFGFTLDTIPYTTGDGHIELELQPALTVPGDRLPIPNPVTGSLDPIGEPASETREATVRVRVKDGSTLVIGGLLRRQINHVEGRTPIFGFIPGLAPIFTERSDIESTQNLLILVTARIIPED
jgi:type II secretory pathway component GspD/PulD (secretin)